MEKQLLDLVELLKKVAPHVYAIYVRQATNLGISYLMVSVIFMGIIYVLYRFALWMHKETERTKDSGWLTAKSYELEMTFTVIGMIILTVGVLIFAAQGILHVSNPEYYAIQAMFGR